MTISPLVLWAGFLTQGFNVGIDKLLNPKSVISPVENLAKTAQFSSLAKSPEEYQIISKVADEYGLTDEQRKLLFSIRQAENGEQGKEFGVLNDEAMRFAKDPDKFKSLDIQARWAAGTIKKRYTGDIDSFAKRWAPIGAKNDPKNLNKNWAKNVKYYMGVKK